jgi:hypothetical protein
MDDPNEMARLHSAGAMVRHVSPFDDLPTYNNDKVLTADFIQKWVVPYYMEIASYGNYDWVDAVKEVKAEIEMDICLSLLGDFNWRTRLVGSYFAAVKGYRGLIDIIGTHLLKSELCCVGHIYVLTLSFFNDKNCIQYLNKYLDYYLMKPTLYFDQKFIMEAVLYLDKQNQTDYFSKHIENWKALKNERKKIEKLQAQEVARTLVQLEGSKASEDFMASFQSESDKEEENFSIETFNKQIAILRDLNQYNS